MSYDDAKESPWKSVCDGLLLRTRYNACAVAKLYETSGQEGKFAALAVPLAETAEGTVGAMVVVCRCETKAAAEARLAEFKALGAMVAAMAGSIPSSARRGAVDDKLHGHEGILRAASHRSLHEFAFAIANSLKSKTGCEQVCLGLVRGRRIQMLCISGLDNLYPRSPGAKLINQAMEECLDADTILCYQNAGQWDEAMSKGHRLHRRWHHHAANASVASIPLHVQGRCVAVSRRTQTMPGCRGGLDASLFEAGGLGSKGTRRGAGSIGAMDRHGNEGVYCFGSL